VVRRGVNAGGESVLTPWIVYSAVPPAAGVLWLLRQANLIAPTPVWLLAAFLAGGVAITTAADQWYQANRNRFRLNVRILSQIAVTSVMIYAIGWGPMLAIGYLFAFQESIAEAGSQVWRPTALWCLVGMVGGQAAIAAGAVHSFVGQPAVHGLAVLVGLCLVWIIRLQGQTALHKERAEADLRNSEDRFRSLVQNASEVIMVLDSDLHITYVGEAIERLLGRPFSDYIGKNAFDFAHPDDIENLSASLSGLMAKPGATEKFETRIRHADGSWRWVEAAVTNLLEHPSVRGITAIFHDVTERRELASNLNFHAHHDPLTGLPNRRAFFDLVEQALVESRRVSSSVALLFCDLDRFKLVNDSLGHGMGDSLLIKVADRLAAAVRDGDVLARFAGDEFAILMTDTDAVTAATVADRLVGSLAHPIILGERERKVSISIGVAISDPTDEPGDLLREADLAMYQAKERGRGRWALFDTDTEQRVLEAISLETELWQAVERGELAVLFQPEIDIRSGLIVGAEALVRWNHPRRGLIYPDEFIPVAEQSSLILAIDRSVLATACAALPRWRSRGVACPLRLSVNLSPVWFRDPDRIGELIQLVTDSDVTPDDIQLEITERMALGDSPQTDASIALLRDAGFRIAIDDFGTGYCSLAYLSRFHIDALKLDRSFVSAADRSESGAMILKAMVSVGLALNAELVAEGVERVEQLDLLREWGCQLAQGYLFSPPVAEEVLLSLLKQQDRAGAVHLLA
jgi:diguanylate cyclase (GGDEF)-like protein/PAS domain S-box-containing protein